VIVDDMLPQAGKEKRPVLTEIEALQILSQTGINWTDTRLATTKDASVAFFITDQTIFVDGGLTAS
jgi:hypothetical protein